MIHAAVIRVLHRQHPFQVVHDFVEIVGDVVARLGNVERHVVVVCLVDDIVLKHEAACEAGVDDVFVVVARVIPSSGRCDDRPGRALGRRCRRVYDDFVVGMCRRTCVVAGIFFQYRRGGALQIECFHRSRCYVGEGVLRYDDLLSLAFCRQGVGPGLSH